MTAAIDDAMAAVKEELLKDLAYSASNSLGSTESRYTRNIRKGKSQN